MSVRLSQPNRETAASVRSIGLFLALVACIALAFSPAAHAQVTTGSLAGSVVDADGGALPGVTIEAVHVPTGTRYAAVTGSNGRYTLPNVRVGGPYSVTANLEGFQTAQITGVQVGLGRITDVNLTLRLAAIAETITVSAEVDPIITPDRTGSTSAVSEQEIETLPTVSRSLQDFARTNPYFTVDPQDPSATRINVAGRNERYNSIQIDGAVNNDLFGLADTGTPGGQTNTQPISLDAIQQLQLVVSPYDVRQGGFTGGGINAVTRSGTNDWKGSVFGAQRNEDYIGDGPFDRPIAAFDEEQYGFRLGGPIFRDRLFFFINGEVNAREEATGVSADGSTGTVFNKAAEAARLRTFLIDTYGYDPGSLGDFPQEQESDLFFGRIDWNIGNSHQATLRHNYVDAARDVVSGRSRFSFRFPTAIYTIADETNSSVLQVNSIFGPNAFNEARVSLQTIRDKRDTPVIFPTVEIGGTGPRRGDLHVGTERFSGANSLDQDILAITDDFTFVRGSHTITVGTHNEIFEFKNLFLSDFYGYYYFKTLADFESGIASEYSIGFATGDDPRRATQFEARQYGLYASDQWRMNDRFTLTLGLRADMPDFVDTPSFNPAVQSALGYSTAATPSDDPVLSPRIGFNWDPTGDGRQQLRGGIGVFAGRTPYVWISNAYGNTGVESRNLSVRGSIPFNPDPFDQPRDLGRAGSVTVDLIDPEFEFPRVLRTTLGYDRELFWRVRGTAEVIWSQTEEDVFYYNVNKVQNGTSPLDGRPTFTTVSRDFRDAVLLSNTGKGEEMVASLQLNSRFAGGFTVSGGYSWMDAESAMDATSSRAISNWQFRPTPGDIFEQDVATSSFQREHRFNVAASYNFVTGPIRHNVGLFYNAMAGRPYSLLMGGDPNTDGYSTNDLLYIPGSADEIILQDSRGNVIDYDRLATFLKAAGADPTAGRILDRNELREPWSRLLDFHYELGLPIRGIDTSIQFDISNLLNMIDSDYGVVEYIGFQTYTPVSYRGIDSATGKPIYREQFNGALDPGEQFSTSDTRSRWQARLGLRVSF